MNVRIIALGLVLVSILLASACQRSYLRDGLVRKAYPLQESDLYVAPAACLQNVTVQSVAGAQTSHYQLVYDATGDSHKLIVLSSVGQRLATVTHSGKKVSIEKSLPIRLAFPAEELLVAMQLIYWPESILREGILLHGWHIVDDAKSRLIYKGDDLIVKIVYQGLHGCAGAVEYSLAGGGELLIKGVSF